MSTAHLILSLDLARVTLKYVAHDPWSSFPTRAHGSCGCWCWTSEGQARHLFIMRARSTLVGTGTAVWMIGSCQKQCGFGRCHLVQFLVLSFRHAWPQAPIWHHQRRACVPAEAYISPLLRSAIIWPLRHGSRHHIHCYDVRACVMMYWCTCLCHDVRACVVCARLCW